VVDDARHTMMVARTAAHYGAVVRTSTQVVSLLREGDRVVGVAIRDSEDGAVTEVHGHVVINATGVWTDEIQALSRERGRFRVRASKGVHIVVPRDRIVSEVAIILRTEKSVLFVIPWGTHWIIGTTDTDWNLDLAHPRPPRSTSTTSSTRSTPCWPPR
jgi:glycerol-3-phosphate dehydrogenase